MAFIFVQTLLALLSVSVLSTNQDLGRVNLSVGTVRQIDVKLNPTDVNNQDLNELRQIHSKPRVARSNSYDNEGTRIERSLTGFNITMNIADTINSLRSYAEASDMNFLTSSTSLSIDAAIWTTHCNADAIVDASLLAYGIVSRSSTQPNQVSALTTAFNTSTFYYALRSVELQFVGAGYSYCSSVRYNGQNYANTYLAIYLFSYTSDFNENVKQYTLGESCTTCRSGRYWCYQGLCKDYCPTSDSNCYCNSYCLNCANTNRTTCACQCLAGWSGQRCETKTYNNATAPTCSTTARVPITRITTRMTTTAAALQITSHQRSVASIGKPMIQLYLFAAMALFLRLHVHIN